MLTVLRRPPAVGFAVAGDRSRGRAGSHRQAVTDAVPRTREPRILDTEQVVDSRRGTRPVEQEPLSEVTDVAANELNLVLGLDPLGDDAQAEAVGKRNGSSGDGASPPLPRSAKNDLSSFT